jgi:hypothetical protein
MATPGQLEVMARHYLIACIWADAPEGTKPRATVSAFRKAMERCRTFAELAGPLLERAASIRAYGSHPDCGGVHPGYAAAGHDLYLTSAGHGVGFWDRDCLREDGLGDQLSALCGWRKPIGEPCPEFYRGWLYLN